MNRGIETVYPTRCIYTRCLQKMDFVKITFCRCPASSIRTFISFVLEYKLRIFWCNILNWMFQHLSQMFKNAGRILLENIAHKYILWSRKLWSDLIFWNYSILNNFRTAIIASICNIFDANPRSAKAVKWERNQKEISNILHKMLQLSM